ncbi:DUF3000 domain-containing protein [Kineococcus terrestris]|uniref:DUF3000 domain-containing protein n=1 Tax=Kineococcus terrestris TaxID=2044856 RepID=UPI0034DB5B7A
MTVTRVRPGDGAAVPPAFADAVAALRAVRVRPEVAVTEVAAPARIAPHAAALSGEVLHDGEELATGRFILLHDPAAPPEWGGAFRVVTYARAGLEAELGADPLLGRVGWSWLEDALAGAGARAAEVGGTVTRVLSEGYGALADREASVDVEVRASWTPLAAGGPVGPVGPVGVAGVAGVAGAAVLAPGDVAAHVEAWAVLLCTVAGLPPVPEGVSSLGRPYR